MNKRLLALSICCLLFIPQGSALASSVTKTSTPVTKENLSYKIISDTLKSFQVLGIDFNTLQKQECADFLDKYVEALPVSIDNSEHEHSYNVNQITLYAPTPKLVNLTEVSDAIENDKTLGSLSKNYLEEFIPYLKTNMKYTDTGYFNAKGLLNLYNLYTQGTTPSAYMKKMGFDGDLVEWVSTNRPYDWYINQLDTGASGRVNCAPTSATMALKWYNKDFNVPVSDVANGGWWTLDKANEYIKKYAPAGMLSIKDDYRNQIESIINQGSIIEIGLNSNYITPGAYGSHIGSYGNQFSGHAILVKGFIKTTKGMYVEVYDPWGGSLYSDKNSNQLQGKDRYYNIDELFKGITAFDSLRREIQIGDSNDCNYDVVGDELSNYNADKLAVIKATEENNRTPELSKAIEDSLNGIVDDKLSPQIDTLPDGVIRLGADTPVR